MALRLAGLAVILLCSLVARSQSDSILPPHRSVSTSRQKCQEITIPLCRGIGYNMTWLPNQFDMESQQEIALEIHQFIPLVHIQCSSDFLFFLCSTYLPLCPPNYHKPLLACRSVCERARLGCTPILHAHNFAWPERMNCSLFPEMGDRDNLCMDAINASASASIPASGSISSVVEERVNKAAVPTLRLPTFASAGIKDHQTTQAECNCSCSAAFVRLANNERNARISVAGLRGRIANCAQNCSSVFLKSDERRFIVFWIGLWSILCLISTCVTVLTFLADSTRFQYPERPIIWISFCYVMVSVGYITRLIVGHEEVACEALHYGNESAANAAGSAVASTVWSLRYESSGSIPCTSVFLLTYFFGMAASIWWVILCFCWLLSAGMKWSQEAISSYSHVAHGFAWGLSAMKTVILLVISGVDGDPVAGICYVGNTNLLLLRIFVLAPNVIYLLLGVTFLIAGLIAMFRIRNEIKTQSNSNVTDTLKLEKLMLRLGVFAVLYTVPTTIVIACQFYESWMRENWERSLSCSLPCSPRGKRELPDYSVYVIKYLMLLVIGITSVFWIWTRKTLTVWRNAFTCRHRPSYQRASVRYDRSPASCKFSTSVATRATSVHDPDGTALLTSVPSSTRHVPSTPRHAVYVLRADENYDD